MTCVRLTDARNAEEAALSNHVVRMSVAKLYKQGAHDAVDDDEHLLYPCLRDLVCAPRVSPIGSRPYSGLEMGSRRARVVINDVSLPRGIIHNIPIVLLANGTVINCHLFSTSCLDLHA